MTFIQFCGLWAFGMGGYGLLILAIPKLRPRQAQRRVTKLVVILGICACFLFGLWAFQVARPYTFIAAMAIGVVGSMIEWVDNRRHLPRKRTTARFSPVPPYQRRY